MAHDERDAGRARRGIRSPAPRPPPAAHGRPRPERAEPHRDAPGAALRPHVRRGVQPGGRADGAPARARALGTGHRADSCSRCSRSGGRGSTTRGSRRPTTTTTSSSASPRWCEMLGVLVLALGLPALFHSLDEGEHVDNGVVVAGYVVMRVATIALWLRAAKHDPARRRTALTYVVFVSVTQLGWIVAHLRQPAARRRRSRFTPLLIVLELVGPYVAEHGREGGTPWHAHHIAERYGLLVIITLGEIILGTILAISAVVDEQGWSAETVAVAFGGTALAFGLWWVYFTMPSGKVLARFRRARLRLGLPPLLHLRRARRRRCRPARGRLRDRGRRAHRHRAGAADRRRARSGSSWSRCSRSTRCCCGSSTRSTSGCSSAASSCSCSRWSPVAAGASFGVGILITAASPFVVVVGYETVGHRHQAAALRGRSGTERAGRGRRRHRGIRGHDEGRMPRHPPLVSNRAGATRSAGSRAAPRGARGTRSRRCRPSRSARRAWTRRSRPRAHGGP